MASRTAIEAAIHEDAVHPPFQYRWRSEPPEWKLQHEQIGPHDFVDFVLNLFGKRSILPVEALLCLGVEALWIDSDTVVSTRFARCKIRAVQIAEVNCVTVLRQHAVRHT